MAFDPFREFSMDVLCAVSSLLLLLIYYLYHAARVRRDPSYSIHYVNALARRAWVESVMSNDGKDVMAV